MLRWALLLTAALAATSPARAVDLADDRLAEPGAFARFADAARSHTDAPAVPLGAAFASPQAFREPAPTASASAPADRYPTLSPVPTPARTSVRPRRQAAPKRTPARTRRSGPSPKGIALVAIGAMLLIALRPERAQAVPSLAETWTPPPTWKREWPPTSAPAPLPPLKPSPGWGFSDERDA